ncbi:MAG: ketopantoate reductase, partial [Polyangiaceae bacterium]|nr:ketopantoate reductase [Polyangiaceae bacterium]
MKVLVVGAGAVGQVYAAHLKRSGAHVALYVRPERAEDARRGLTLYRMRALFRRHVVETFVADQVVVSAAEVAAEGWDQVWLCVPTTALAGAWVEALLRAAGDATVVTIAPGVEVRARVSSLVPPANVVTGLVGLLAYQGPLPGEPLDPGVAYMFPPFAKSRFSGHPDRVDPVVEALRRGGCPATGH